MLGADATLLALQSGVEELLASQHTQQAQTRTKQLADAMAPTQAQAQAQAQALPPLLQASREASTDVRVSAAHSSSKLARVDAILDSRGLCVKHGGQHLHLDRHGGDQLHYFVFTCLFQIIISLYRHSHSC